MNKKKALLELIFYLVGVYTSFLIFAVFQEKLYKHQYINTSDGTTSKFTHSQATALFPSLACCLVGYLRRKVSKEGSSKVPKKQQAILGGLYYLMQYSIGTALVYISYPTQLIFTNLKLLTIYMVETFFSRTAQRVKKLEASRIYLGCFITVGIFLYSHGNMKKAAGHDHTIGIILIILSLISQGFLVDNQTYIKQRYKPSSNDLFTATNKVTFLLSLCVSIALGQIKPIFNFIWNYERFGMDLLCLCVFGTLGQICLYELIKRFKPSIYALFTVFRKVLTITISILAYGHETNLVQIAGIAIVFSGLFYELHSQIDAKKAK